ncbi:glycosyltransferase family 39 protein [Paenibacillus sp. CN-4]|uniref:glycosyltransferase family 39 protein n=1 Tax=Paenibacillus nanchangensis TaxID=3348343 RepID=UPI00397892C3
MRFKIATQTLYLMLALFAGLFIVSSLFIRARYSYYVYGDTPVLEKQQLGALLAGAGLLLAFGFLLHRLCRPLNKYKPNAVLPLVLCLSGAVQTAVVFAFTRVPTDDSQTVLSLALDMLYRSDYSSFEGGGYLYMFPFNFSTVLYLETLLAVFPDNYLVLKAGNILFSLVTSLMIYLIHQELGGKNSGKNYGVLVFAAAYPPALLMSNFIYNDVIATALLTVSIYFTIRFVKRKTLASILFASIALAAGNYFRGVGAIVLIAALIYILFNTRSIGWKKTAVSLALLAVCFNVPGWTQTAVLQAAHITDEPASRNAAPVYMWLHMGLNEETFGFWDNMESYSIYQREAGYNKAESTVLFKAAIREKLSSATGRELASLYFKKLVWTWTEGTYQLDRYGIGGEGGMAADRATGPVMGGYVYSTAVSELFQGDSPYRSGLLWLLYCMNFLMYCGMLIRLISGIRSHRRDEVFLVLVVLGFIGFYLLWEIKSRYLFPVYPVLIVLSYSGFRQAYQLLLQKKEQRKSHALRAEKPLPPKSAYRLARSLSLLGCAVLLTSCSAITAQQIGDSGSGSGMNGARPGDRRGGGAAGEAGGMRPGGMDRQGPGQNFGRQGRAQAAADVTGTVVAVDGDKLTVQTSGTERLPGGADGKALAPDSAETGSGALAPDSAETGDGALAPDSAETGDGALAPESAAAGGGAQAPESAAAGGGAQAPDSDSADSPAPSQSEIAGPQTVLTLTGRTVFSAGNGGDPSGQDRPENSLSRSDLQAGQTVRIWLTEGTTEAERVQIVQP